MIRLLYHPVFARHDAGPDHPECPERVLTVHAALASSSFVSSVAEPAQAGRPLVAAVHDGRYLDLLSAADRQGGGSLDPETRLGPESLAAALHAAGAVSDAVDSALSGGPCRAFALVRPPGHHARPGGGMGFCLINNIAVGAAAALAHADVERVAIVDFDVHHGNGTQEAFYEDGRVFYLSLHRHPFYPGTGRSSERGAGEGENTTRNFPLRAGTDPSTYRDAFRAGLDEIAAWSPDILLVSAGFDAYRDDPIGGLGLAADDFHWIGAELASLADGTCEGRVVAALEGGYALDALPGLVLAFVEGLG